MGIIWRRHRRKDAAQPSPARDGRPALAALPEAGNLHVSRTLVLSEPEVQQLITSDPRLRAEGIEVSMTGKGFGTRVSIIARPPSRLDHRDLERLLDELAEPQKRPFSNA